MDGEILSELDDNLREEVIETLAPAELAQAVRELETDDVVDLVEDLHPAQQEALLAQLAPADRVAVEKALAYPEYSAGRLMQVEVVRCPEDWTVGEAIDFMRSSPMALPDQFYHVAPGRSADAAARAMSRWAGCCPRPATFACETSPRTAFAPSMSRTSRGPWPMPSTSTT